MKVIFLDRDGIINLERGEYTWEIKNFEFTRNFFPFLRTLTNEGYKFIVITNQGGINKELYSQDDVQVLHEWMKSEFEKEDIKLLDVFYCPHHSDFQKCLCRKPGSLLIEKALAIHQIDPSKSIMLGDRERDVEAANRAGIKGILIESNPDWNDIDLKTLIN